MAIIRKILYIPPMRQWTLNHKPPQKLEEGTVMISLVREASADERVGGLHRMDIPEIEGGLEIARQEKGVLGWWRWTVTRRPPTQRELNDRLEQLFLSLKTSSAAHKGALIWLVGLYLTRKRILRQEGSVFTHIKSNEKFEVAPDAIDPAAVEAAMTELMAVIS